MGLFDRFRRAVSQPPVRTGSRADAGDAPPAPEARDPRPDPAAAREPRPFSIACRRRPSDEPLSLERPALLIRVAGGPPQADVRSLAGICRTAGRPLAVLAPSLDSASVDEMHSLGIAVIEAADQPGQPVRALLEDAATYSGAICLSQDLGWPAEITADRDYAPLVMPEAIVLRLEDLGALARLEYTAGTLTLLAREASPGVEWRVAQLSRSVAVDDVEASGLRTRVSRLGGPVVEIQRAPPPVFARDGESLRVPAGYRSPYLITDPERMEARLAPAGVFVTRRPVAWADMAALLLSTIQEGASAPSPLLIVAPRVSDEALAVLVVNKLRGLVSAVAVEVADETWRQAIGEFSGARPAPQPFDPDARRGAVDAVVCDPRSLALSRGGR